MKTITQVIQFIEERVGHIYFRPRMYGGNASGTDTVLHYYHELWAEIHDSTDDFHKTKEKIEKEQKCESANFSTKYKNDNPHFSDVEVADYVVIQWKKISAQMNMKIPYETLNKIYTK